MLRRVPALLVFLALAPLAPRAVAQICGPGQTFLKNDNLPAVPTSSQVTINQLACNIAGPGIGAVLDVSALGSVVKIDQVAVGYYGVGGFPGGSAACFMNIHDGIAWTGSTAELGPRVFSSTPTLTSTGINATDVSAHDVRIHSGKAVVTWTVVFFNDPIGDCSTGLWANFATDAAHGGAVCDPLVTPLQKNLYQGSSGPIWSDPATAGAPGSPLCPQYYSGNWLIRICAEPLAAAGATFCVPGTSTTLPCACGNPAASLDRGCDNSAGTGGAQLLGSGVPSVGAPSDTLRLSAFDLLPTVGCIFLQGDAALVPGAPFGDGVRCIGGSLKRLGAKTASVGYARYPGPGDPSVSARSAALGDPIAPGSTRRYQTYYRDPADYACAAPATFNVTQGLSILWQ